MHQLRIKAIFWGVVAGFVAGAVWSIINAVLLPTASMPHGDVATALASSSSFLLSSLLGAFLSSLVSGWAAARMTAGAEIVNSVAVGVVILLLSAAMFLPVGMNHYPLWYNIPAFGLTVPFTFLGGLIVSKTRARNDS